MTDTPEHIVKKRILALHQMAQLNCIQTGGDPAEAVMDLLIAACAIADQQRPNHGVAELMATVMPAAIASAADWFPPKTVARDVQ